MAPSLPRNDLAIAYTKATFVINNIHNVDIRLFNKIPTAHCKL